MEALSHADTFIAWGSDLTGQFRLSPRFSAIANFSLFRVVTDGGSTSAVTSDAIAWMGHLNITSEVTKTITLQGAYNYRAPMKIERGEFGAQQQTAWAVVFEKSGAAAAGAIKRTSGNSVVAESIVRIRLANLPVRVVYDECYSFASRDLTRSVDRLVFGQARQQACAVFTLHRPRVVLRNDVNCGDRHNPNESTRAQRRTRAGFASSGSGRRHSSRPVGAASGCSVKYLPTAHDRTHTPRLAARRLMSLWSLL